MDGVVGSTVFKLTERGKLNSVAPLSSRIVASSAPVTKVVVSRSASDDLHFDSHAQSLSFFYVRQVAYCTIDWTPASSKWYVLVDQSTFVLTFPSLWSPIFAQV